jgi:hypothetical protein
VSEGGCIDFIIKRVHRRTSQHEETRRVCTRPRVKWVGGVVSIAPFPAFSRRLLRSLNGHREARHGGSRLFCFSMLDATIFVDDRRCCDDGEAQIVSSQIEKKTDMAGLLHAACWSRRNDVDESAYFTFSALRFATLSETETPFEPSRQGIEE